MSPRCAWLTVMVVEHASLDAVWYRVVFTREDQPDRRDRCACSALAHKCLERAVVPIRVVVVGPAVTQRWRTSVPGIPGGRGR
jgi:hypothetical protein